MDGVLECFVDGILDGNSDGALENVIVGNPEGDGECLLDGNEVGNIEGIGEGISDGISEDSTVGKVDGTALVIEDGAWVGFGVGGTSMLPYISSTSIRYEELNLCKFGHTSSNLSMSTPTHDAIPRNAASQGVVGIIRPIVKR